MRNEDLRVALFTDTFLPKLDGVVTVMCLLLDHLKAIGAEAMVFSPGKHIESYNGYRVYAIERGVPMPMYPEITLAIPGKGTARAIENFRPNIIHVANPFMAGLRGIAYARWLEIPLLMSFHTHVMNMAKFYDLGFLENPLWALHRYFYQKADFRVATSKRIQQELIDHRFGETGLWRRGVNPEVFSPKHYDPEVRRKFVGDDENKILLLFVGRLAPEKQIEQIKAVLDAVPNTHLLIIGDGPYRETLEEVYRGSAVTFAGYLSGQDLSAAYCAADVFVFPSAIETFGLVVAEAMAAGLPVVTTRVGGIPEIITHGENGFIFEPNDIPQMIEYVRLLAGDKARRKALGQRAHESIQHLTWPAIMDELIEHYKRLIALKQNAR